MSKFRVGDKVRVVDSGKRYPAHFEWVEENAPMFLREWANGRYFGRHFKVANSRVGHVLAAAPHGSRGGAMLYLVRAAEDDNLFLIAEHGLELVPDCKDSKIVITTDGKTT